MQPQLTFIQITDTHIGPARDSKFYSLDLEPYRCLERVIGLINDLPQPPDFVVHTGDLSHDHSPESYALAREALDTLRVPVYYVNGNHDDRASLREYFGAPAHPGGDPHAPLDYTFELKGERFLVVDGHNEEVQDPLGKLSDDQLEWVRAEARPDGPPLTIIMHYPLFQMGSPWLDEHMILVNGDALHAALLPARGRLRGVFCGHLHRSCQILCDGITYSSAPSAVAQYGWRPWDQRPLVDHDFLPGYNVVQYFDGKVIVHQFTFPPPTQS
jgi:Icc protein